MKKTIQKPQNWQDFESLCKKLWGEIWDIPSEIKKNGRQGQPQAGVDVYGIPKGATQYSGIQCKGKDDYAETKLTEAEIDKEVENAKTFEPELEAFIIATSGNKDVKIEAYVRKLDVESRKNGGFKILLFCWEDIADLLEENPRTYSYYVNGKHKTKFDFEVSFDKSGSKQTTIKPQFIRKIKRYEPESSRRIHKELNPFGFLDQGPFQFNMHNASAFVSHPESMRNLARCEINFVLKNIGSSVIEDWEISFELGSNVQEIMDYNKLEGSVIANFFEITHDTGIRIQDDVVKYHSPTPLTQGKTQVITIYVMPESDDYIIPIEWKLLARDYNVKGTLSVVVDPIIDEEVVKREYVDAIPTPRDEFISMNGKLVSIEDNEN